MHRNIAIITSFVLGVAFIALQSCTVLLHAAKVLDPAIIVACQAEAIDLGYPQLAQDCADADKIVDALTILSAARKSKLAACNQAASK